MLRKTENRAGVDKLLQMKIYICCEPRTSYLIPRGYHRKTIKVIKHLCVKCAPATGIAIGIAIAYNIR